MKCLANTEEEMRNTEPGWPKTIGELDEYIDSLVNRKHDYGTCVYALSLSALAAFNYVAHKLGVTGFQASCADLDFLSKNRGIKGGFILLKADDLLYPQYNLREKLEEFINSPDQRKWLKEQAEIKIKESNGNAHPEVIRHWQNLASYVNKE